MVMEDESLDVLAKKADRILDQRADAPGSVAAINEVSSSSSPSYFTVGEVDAVQPRRSPAPGGTGASAGNGNGYICNGHAHRGSKSFSCKTDVFSPTRPLQSVRETATPAVKYGRPSLLPVSARREEMFLCAGLL